MCPSTSDVTDLLLTLALVVLADGVLCLAVLWVCLLRALRQVVPGDALSKWHGDPLFMAIRLDLWTLTVGETVFH